MKTKTKSKQKQNCVAIDADADVDVGVDADLCQDIVTTEASPVMTYRCQQKGFEAIQTCTLDVEQLQNRTFHLISLLNVLDRCDDPFSLLRDIKVCINTIYTNTISS